MIMGARVTAGWIDAADLIQEEEESEAAEDAAAPSTDENSVPTAEDVFGS
jgi:hypothetical protein